MWSEMSSSQRADSHKPEFQVRDPNRDPVSKILCGITPGLFACDQPDERQVLGEVPRETVPRSKQYTLEEYRNRWTKGDVKSIERFNSTEHRDNMRQPTFRDNAVCKPG